nr:4'-phosphopantetheinyl transferase superfamily protein [uncultured Desulfobulbus sp.]
MRSLCEPIFAHAPPLLPSFEDCQISLIDLDALTKRLQEKGGEGGLVSLLSVQEQQLFANFSHPKRRVEWLGGRLAVKCALVRLLETLAKVSPATVSVLPDAQGKPWLSSSSACLEGIGLSISHSGHFAAAMVVQTGCCGVDIQCRSDRLLKVQERFATDAELALLHKEQYPLARLAMLWTAKEALKKCFLADAPTFFGKLEVKAADRLDERQWLLHCRLRLLHPTKAVVQVVLFDQYALAWVRGDNHA